MDIKEFSDQIKKIINAQDPIHLIAVGAPEDEYNLEVGEISHRLVNNKDGKQTRDIVREVFVEKFDEETARESAPILGTIADQIDEMMKGIK